ncbi:MAG: hypothetical protein K8F27_01865 [Sulfuricellaceae bacterium]|nr:hypothetical protein [Sulfuricellaceae bacterium]
MSTCLKCGLPIEGQAETGRPKSYCSVGCRRSAEHEVRRINSLLQKLETDLSNALLGRVWADQVPKIEAEISRQETRLRILLDTDEFEK